MLQIQGEIFWNNTKQHCSLVLQFFIIDQRHYFYCLVKSIDSFMWAQLQESEQVRDIVGRINEIMCVAIRWRDTCSIC